MGKINIAIFNSRSLKYYASHGWNISCFRRNIPLKRQNFSRPSLSTKELAQMAFDNENKNEGIATIPDIALLPGGAP